MVRMMASNPDYRKFKMMQERIHVGSNPHIYFNGYVEDDVSGEKFIEMSSSDWNELKEILFNEMQELIDNYESLPGYLAELLNDLENEDSEYDSDINLNLFGIIE